VLASFFYKHPKPSANRNAAESDILVPESGGEWCSGFVCLRFDLGRPPPRRNPGRRGIVARFVDQPWGGDDVVVGAEKFSVRVLVLPSGPVFSIVRVSEPFALYVVSTTRSSVLPLGRVTSVVLTVWPGDLVNVVSIVVWPPFGPVMVVSLS